MANKQDKFYAKVNDYYNKHKDDIAKKIQLSDKYEFVFAVNNDVDIVEVYLDGKVKMRAEYNIIGMYNIALSVWYWGWNIAFVNKKLIENIVPIKEFVGTLTKQYMSFGKGEADELHYILTNDNFYVSGEHIDKMMRFVLYQANGIWYFPIKHIGENKKPSVNEPMDKIEYILITKIIQFD